MAELQITWFFVIGVLIGGYAILDGFDLGVGFWHLGAKKDKDRRILLNSIGPVWDGNEVWLLTGGGAIFAAFPPVYATVFSGFYLAMMLVLLALIMRAVSLEFRSKVEDPLWRKIWDVCFSLGSTLAAILFGVAVGNILRGIPLDADGNFTGTFFGLLNPYAVVVGVFSLAMVATHGAVFIALRTEGELQQKALSWAKGAWVAYLAAFLAVTGWTVSSMAHLMENFAASPVLWAIPAVAAGAIVAIIVLLRKGLLGKAFIASSLSIAALLGTAGASLFPRWVPAQGDLSLSLTVYNSSSSELTLKTMLILALVGMPLVIGYTVFIYRTFWGKVELDEHSY